MKLFNAYKKELKIASRGFYFYIELIIAVVVLAVLMMLVKEYPDGHMDEYIYYDVPEEHVEYLIQRDINAGRIVMGEDKEIKLKPGRFTVENIETHEAEDYEYTEGGKMTVKTVNKINPNTGKLNGTVYLMPDRESMLRMAFRTGKIGASIVEDEQGRFYYEYIDQGYETDRYNNVLYVLHNFDPDKVDAQQELQNIISIGTVERLNTRQAVIPVYVTLACSLMSFFIICAYIFLDKTENVIKAFLVTPSSLTTYLLSKVLLVMTAAFLSATIVVLPVMGFKPNYLLFIPLLLASTFQFCCIGLFVGSFYDNMNKAFGVLYLIMMIMILPMISYYVGSFDPMWIHLLPTWSIMESFKILCQGQTGVLFPVIVTAGCLLVGVIMMKLAEVRFRKTLNV